MSTKPVKICDLLISAARRWPDKPALSFEGVTQTWGETLTRCHLAATWLRQAGVTKGDRVAYLGFNSNVCFESYYSPALIGAVMVPINYRLSIPEMAEQVEDCAPKVLIIDPYHVEQARDIARQCAGVSAVLCAGNRPVPDDMQSYEAEIKRLAHSGELCELNPGQDDEIVMIFYTGGTTGRAKGVMLSNSNLQTNTDCSVPLYRMGKHWSFLIAGPLFHLAAGARVFSCAALGGHAVILPKFDVETLLQAVERYRINSATLVPTMLRMILDHPAFGDYDLSSLRMVAFGAAPMPPALLQRIIRAFPGVEIFQTYGMTEASPILSSLDSQHHLPEGLSSDKLGSVGRAVGHVELRIVDRDDNPLPAGHIGEIVARGDNIMAGYWQRPELTDEALRGGWYHTGDSGYLDEEGYLFLEGRVKDMIVSGGENVYPIEVENAMAAHPAVKECAVIGIPHQTWGEAVHGIVVLEEGMRAGERELIDYCKNRIAHYKCPVSVTVRDKPMPLSPINKILKTELRKPFWEGRESSLV